MKAFGKLHCSRSITSIVAHFTFGETAGETAVSMNFWAGQCLQSGPCFVPCRQTLLEILSTQGSALPGVCAAMSSTSTASSGG